MSFLDLSTYEPLPPANLDAPEVKKSPATAFLLSLLFPGFGHFYLGLKLNAAWIAGFALLQVNLSVAGFVWRSARLIELAFTFLSATYIFGFLDAFFSAKEWNAGVTPLMIGANPRTAAFLNLLTNGLGYFYLGERTKGLITFVALGVLPYALMSRMENWKLRTAGIILHIALAFDGWRVGRRLSKEQHPEITKAAIATHDAEGLPAFVPAGVACVIALGLASFLAFGVMMQASVKINRTNAEIRQISNRQRYSDPAYGVTFATPLNWTMRSGAEDDMLAKAQGGDYPCSVQLLRYPNYFEPQQLIETKLQYLPDELEGSKSERDWTQFEGRPAFELTAQTAEGNPVSMHYVAFSKGNSTFMWIETRAGSCGPAVDAIRDSLVFK